MQNLTQVFIAVFFTGFVKVRFHFPESEHLLETKVEK